MTRFFAKVLMLFFVGSLGVSCVSSEKIVYFQDLSQGQLLLDTIQKSSKIQSGDLLSIVVSAYDLNAVRPFNLISETRPSTEIMGVAANNNNQQQAYLTAQDGSIDFPILGRIQVVGLTRVELSELLAKRISEYVKEPIVTIRILNFKVSLLGEVNRPGTYNFEGERLTLPAALGLAGDMTIYGRRDNVLVIRDDGKTKNYKYLDMRSANVLNSEYYYLQQNDVVYVEPNRAQVQGSSFNRNTAIYVSIASLLLSAMAIIFR
ncbi:polysaccharide biosynthesis/export family protein [Aequorivita sp. SDUM287046]|uniref:Polysaccharide biosynthesis/export family protein n=1 Tax=Aequorivita aurantiaca TaxID=3053356 RepID=A0ABT8DL37_9FLAO|nr:polysaccharide biosynthesis/export family protein [Aequorivita aurantiaca]MDN3723953.1 polysaccharide biosynthesis/export family protein [Aequorivita aurantiaca]